MAQKSTKHPHKRAAAVAATISCILIERAKLSLAASNDIAGVQLKVLRIRMRLFSQLEELLCC